MANQTRTKETKGEKNHPPSYYKYREKNPTISIKITKQTKEALDAARGEVNMSYAEFIKSLFVPDGLFSQFVSGREALKSERTAFETERKNLVLEYKNKMQDLENERKKLNREFNEKCQDLETDREELALEYEEKNRAFEVERNALIRENEKIIQVFSQRLRDMDSIEHFSVPCPICHQPMQFTSAQPDWYTKTMPRLLYVFQDYAHDECRMRLGYK